VGDEDEGDAKRTPQALQLLLHLFAQLQVKRAERFVEDQLADFKSLAALARDIHAGALSLEEALAEAPFGAAARDAFDRALPQLRGELLD
jgi:hypothetical protein